MKKGKTSSGWTMVGICIQWVLDNNNLNGNELKIYTIILRNSFGFKKKWCYLQYEDFGLSKATVSKTIKHLKSLGIISYKNTFKEDGNKSLNEYKILEPKQHIRNFIFIGSKDYVEEEKEEDKNPWEE